MHALICFGLPLTIISSIAPMPVEKAQIRYRLIMLILCEIDA